MTELVRFHLEVIPQPPQSGRWADHLRWCVAVMDEGDPDLGMTASLMGYCLQKRHISERQKVVAHRIMTRVYEQYNAGILRSQLAIGDAQELANTIGKRL